MKPLVLVQPTGPGAPHRDGRFKLRDGRLRHSPATAPLPVYLVSPEAVRRRWPSTPGTGDGAVGPHRESLRQRHPSRRAVWWTDQAVQAPMVAGLRRALSAEVRWPKLASRSPWPTSAQKLAVLPAPSLHQSRLACARIFDDEERHNQT